MTPDAGAGVVPEVAMAVEGRSARTGAPGDVASRGWAGSSARCGAGPAGGGWREGAGWPAARVVAAAAANRTSRPTRHPPTDAAT